MTYLEIFTGREPKISPPVRDINRNRALRLIVSGIHNQRDVAPSLGGCPQQQGRRKMKGVLLWLLGLPIPVILLLYLFNVI